MKSFVLAVFTLVSIISTAQSESRLYPLRGQKSWYYSDSEGRIAIDERFTVARPFYNGLAVASDKTVGMFDPLLGLIRSDGSWLIQPEYEVIGSFVDGVAPFKRKGKWGLLNAEGQTSMPATFQETGFIGDRYCGVETNYKWGFADYFGNIRIAEVYNQVTPFEAGRAMVRLGSRWIMIDKNGRQCVKGDWDYADALSEGLAPVRYSGGLWSYIDTSGRRVIQPAYKDARPFREGRAAVRISEYYGFIDHTGKEVVSAVYTKVADFSEGYAAVYYRGKWGYVDRYGKVIVRAIYTDAEPFQGGLARVKDSSGRFFYINKDGLVVLSGR